MLYPFLFNPVYKDYLWGGRELEKFGKKIPEGIAAESWEISCHPDGISSVSNGEFSGWLLTDLVDKFGNELAGNRFTEEEMKKFPLLIKFIDANDRLSVQVHPSDEYAMVHENGEYGKNEMWYIIDSKPGAKLIYGVKPGITKEKFIEAIKKDCIGETLSEIEVFPGDIVNIPAGLVHAIGKGIVLAEIQQNSNTTYRVYDYKRIDKYGKSRPLHIEKALEVINFNLSEENPKVAGLEVKIDDCSKKTYKIANKYFSVELYEINSAIEEHTDGSRFEAYVVVEGEGSIVYNDGEIRIHRGDSVLIPAALGRYSISGGLKALKTYVPDIEEDIVKPLLKAGYSMEDIYRSIEGLTES